MGLALHQAGRLESTLLYVSWFQVVVLTVFAQMRVVIGACVAVVLTLTILSIVQATTHARHTK